MPRKWGRRARRELGQDENEYEVVNGVGPSYFLRVNNGLFLENKPMLESLHRAFREQFFKLRRAAEQPLPI